MARTQAADYEQRRDAIISAAAKLFAARGFALASVAELAAAVGTSKSLIYHYYPSKEDILHEVMASHIEALGLAAERIEAEPGTPEDRLSRLVHAFMALYVGAAARQKVLLNDLDKLPPARRAAIVRLQRGLIAAVERILAGIAPTLTADPPRRRAAAMLLFGMINWTHTWYNPAGPVGPDALADMAVALVLGGISRAATS